jgi:hypothetical protein
MKAIDWTHIYGDKKYKGKWVAVEGPESTTVVAYGKTLDDVLEKAKKKGFELPLVTQIPKRVLPIIGPFTFLK